MDIKEPAVIFSEAGWKAFLQFMGKSTTASEEDMIQALVADHTTRHKKPKVTTTQSEHESEFMAVRLILHQAQQPVDLEFIALGLMDHNIDWGSRPSTWGLKMKKIANRSEDIMRLKNGKYLMIPQQGDDTHEDSTSKLTTV